MTNVCLAVVAHLPCEYPLKGDALLSRLEMEATQLSPADAINPTKCIPNLDTIWEGICKYSPLAQPRPEAKL